MKLAVTLAIGAVLAAPGGAANPWPNGVPAAPPSPAPGGVQGMHGFHHRGFNGGGVLIIEEPPLIVEREVVRQVPVEAAAPPAPPPPPQRWVLGRLYAALPGGCMKMVDRGVTYFQCSGEWYRKVPGGYRAVARP